MNTDNLQVKPLRDDYSFSYSDKFKNKSIVNLIKSEKTFTEMRRYTGDIISLIKIISRGYAIAPFIFTKNYRLKENALKADFWIGDIDKDLTIQEVLAIPFFKKHSFIYTTPSHTSEQHRFRIIVPLPSSIDPSTYERLSDYFDSLLDSKLDPVTKHCATLFYGNDNANFYNLDNVESFSYNLLHEMEVQGIEKKEFVLKAKQAQIKKIQARIKKNISQAPEEKKRAIKGLKLLPPRKKGTNQYQQLRGCIWGLASIWTVESGLDPFSELGKKALAELILLLEDSPIQSNVLEDWDISKLVYSFDPSKGITGGSFFNYINSLKPDEDDEENTKRPKNTKIAYSLIEKLYGHRIKLNLLSLNLELDGSVADFENFYITLAVRDGIEISDKLAWDIAQVIGKKNQYHPIRQYFESLTNQETETISIKHLALAFFGVEDPLYNEMLYRFLIGSVARIFDPGCKMDNVLVLQGKTGYRKSTFFKVLWGSDWFTDSVIDFDTANLLTLHQYWCCEFAELETITSKKQAGQLKAFISRATDTFKRPYAKTSTPHKRQGVIVGSVNEWEFLVDTTGNRRFWVVPIAHKIDTDLIAQWRDRVWYLAYQDYLKGEFWHLEAVLEEKSQEYSQEYLFTDAWLTPELERWIETTLEEKLTLRNIFVHYFNLEEKEITMQNTKRLSKILSALGYVNSGRKRIDGINVRYWRKKA